MKEIKQLIILSLVLFFCACLIKSVFAQDGSLDLTFGTNGIVITDIQIKNDYGYDIAIQADGKLLVAGTSVNGTHNRFAIVRYNTNGTLDNTFDTDGIVITSIIGGDDNGRSIAIQADGKIVVAGYAYNGSNLFDFALARYNSDGSLDNTFDSDGIVVTTIGSGNDYGYDVAIQTDGKIVVAGYAYNGSNLFDFALARYNSDGSLDNTFDSDGIVTTPVGSYDDKGQSVAIQSDGKIVVAGYSYLGTSPDYALVRYNSNGSLDNTFDSDGIVTTSVGTSDFGHSVAVQSDGKIVVAGDSYIGSNYDFVLIRFNTEGSLDNTFDSDGIVTTPVGSSNDYAYSVAIQSDGKILVSGDLYNGSTYDFVLVRYGIDGTLDNSFDSHGIAITPIGSTNEVYGYSIAIQSDGKIIVAGDSDNGVNWDFTLVRYNNPSLSPPGIKIFLEGPYSNGAMDYSANSNVPLNQPYNVPPWNYNGTETTTTNFISTNNIVDWVYIELRSGSSAATATNVVSKRAALVKDTGVIIDTNGSTDIDFGSVSSGNYYIAVFHRNHLPVISSQIVTIN